MKFFAEYFSTKNWNGVGVEWTFDSNSNKIRVFFFLLPHNTFFLRRHRIKILQKKITHQLSIACEITKLKGLLRI